MANWIDREKDELRLDERKVLTAYKDKFGNWTIGIGHFLGKDPSFANLVWTDAQAEEEFSDDVEDKLNDLDQYIDVYPGLDGPRKGVLLNMAFNMGAQTLSTFHSFLNFLDQNKYDEAALDLMHTAYARQVPQRAQRLAYRIRTGQYAKR